MNNKALVLIALVLVVVLGYAWVSDKTTAPTQDQASTLVASSTNQTSGSSTGKQSTSPTKTATKKVEPTVTSSGIYLVYYTNKGFSPNPLEIPKSKSVRFVNTSDKAMRIFSGLDVNDNRGIVNQSKTVGKGGVFDFTFVNVGTWPYYNLNNPLDKGTIIVK